MNSLPGALILPVSWIVARAWANGWIGDAELMLSDPCPDAVYFSTLPDLASFRLALPVFRGHFSQGARVVIFRTNSPAVVHHGEKWGAVRTFQDESGRWRYFVPPDAVGRYFGRMAQKAPAASFVTSSR